MGNTVEYYLSKGFDQVATEYFASGRKRPVSVQPNPDFTLSICFDNGETRLFDVKPLLEPNTVFESFRDWNNFKRVYLDDQKSICWDIDPNVDSEVVWNNKVDLCPDSCYMDSTPVLGR